MLIVSSNISIINLSLFSPRAMFAISQETEKPRRRRRRREARARSWAREVSPGTESRTCYRRRSLSPPPATYSTPFSANTLPSPLWHLICQPIHQLTQQLLLTRQFIVQLLFVWPLNWLSNTFLPHSTPKSQLLLLAFICLLSHFIQYQKSQLALQRQKSIIEVKLLEYTDISEKDLTFYIFYAWKQWQYYVSVCEGKNQQNWI